MKYELPFCIFLILMNLITFLVYEKDKISAEKGRSRVPEKVLLILAFLFGSLGAILQMELFRHKTGRRDDAKEMFRYGVPISYLCQLAMIFFWEYHDRKEYIVAVGLYFLIALSIGLFWKSRHARGRS